MARLLTEALAGVGDERVGRIRLIQAMYSRDVDLNVTGDVFVGYTMKNKVGTTRFTVGVNNVTDQRPSLIYVGFAGDSDASTYDYMGRYRSCSKEFSASGDG